MGGFRAERIAELILREVAQRVPTLKDPRLVPISITKVEVTRDLRRATIEYLPLGGGDVSDEVKEALVDAAKHLRGPVGRALGIRHAPELFFTPDTHTEAAIRVTSLLDRIGRELRDGEDDARPAGVGEGGEE
jgi:ribosome-binding factor A